MQLSTIKMRLCLKGSLLLFMGLLLSSCIAGLTKPKFEDAYTVVTEATISTDSSLAMPDAEPILTISGLIGKSNVTEGVEKPTLLLDRPLLESFGLVEYTLPDPFEEREITYRGVLIRDLLNLLEADSSATELYVVALNDYAVSIPIAEVYEYPVVLALQADGEYMTPDYRGPSMFVYPMHQYDFDKLGIQYRTNWIWQIKSVEVR